MRDLPGSTHRSNHDKILQSKIGSLLQQKADQIDCTPEGLHSTLNADYTTILRRLYRRIFCTQK